MKIDLDIIPSDRAALIEQTPLEAAIKELRKVRETCGLRSELGRKIKRTLNALARKLIRVSQFNIRVLLKYEMLETESWRKRVLDDLGGEDALRRWENRQAEADETVLDPYIRPYVLADDVFDKKPEEENPAPIHHETVNIPGLDAAELKCTHCTTDRDGLFRLAPIRFAIRPDTIQDKFARLEADTWREMMQPLKPKTPKKRPEIFKPIPLTPDELRGSTQTPPQLIPATGDGAKSQRHCSQERADKDISTTRDNRISFNPTPNAQAPPLDPRPSRAYLNRMAIRPILTVPNPILKQISKPVEAVTDETRALMDDMLETMYAAPGIGLAAVQIGVPLNVIVMDLAREGEDPKPQYFVNPEILDSADTLNPYEEGCLSVPDVFDTVERPETVRLTYLNYEGERVTEDCEGLYATCIQHEMDHLKGIVFLDHLSRLKRDRAIKKVVKAEKLKAAS